MRFSSLGTLETAFLVRNYEFTKVKVQEIDLFPSDNGEAEVTIVHSGFLSKTEVVKRKELLSKVDYRSIQKFMSGGSDSVGQMFDSAVKAAEGAVNATGEYASKLRDNFNKFKGEVITDELLEKMRKEAEDSYDPEVIKEKVETASKVMGTAVESMFDKMFKDEKMD